MSRERQVKALLDRCSASLGDVERAYDASLRAKQIGEELRIDIKNLCENLRSSLDYAAADIRDLACGVRKTWCQFPILADPCSFEKKCKSWFPGLAKGRPDLWAYLESMQPYQPQRAWLGTFRDIVNEHKHEGLQEQTRIERAEVRVTGKSGQVSWNPKGVTFGHGVSILGAPIDPTTQMPVPTGGQKVERILWVDFVFDGTSISARGLLREATQGVAAICREVYRLLGA